ncbi:MAG: phage tail assembly chaperone [Pseudomonadota bacterium]
MITWTRHLGLPPESFWRAGFREVSAILAARDTVASEVPTHADLAALMRAFPDT